MQSNRRDAIKAGMAMAMRPIIVPAGIAANALLASCGPGPGESPEQSKGPLPPTSPPVTVAAQLAIASASTLTPRALTPLTLSTTGLDVNQPFLVTVSYPSGKQVPLVPLRTSAAGAVILPTPLYLDIATGKTGSVSVRMSITQNKVTSNAIAVTIQDIPSVATYGTSPGAISRAFFNYLTISLARSENYLQALQAFPANRTNTMSARSAIHRQMLDTIEMRNNIDILLAGTAPSLAVGISSAGTPIQFDATSLDLLDRIIAMHLQAAGYVPAIAGIGPSVLAAQQLSNPTSTSPEVMRRMRIRKGAGNQLRARRLHGSPVSAGIPPASSFKDAILVLGSLAGVTGMISGEINAFQPISDTNTVGDNIASGIGGLASLASVVGLAAEVAGVAVAGVAVAPAILTGAAIVGAVVGAYTLVRDVENIRQTGFTAETGTKLVFDAVGTLAAVVGVNAVGGGLVKDVTGFLAAGGKGVSGAVIQGSGFIANIGLTTLGVVAMVESARTESKNASPPQQLGMLEGSASVTNSQGPILSALPGVVVKDPNTNTQFTSVADSSQQFSFLLPIGVPTFNYSGMTLFPYDPVTGSGSGDAQVVDLRGLSSTVPVIDAVPVTGRCSDDDAGNPDEDDPDCD